MNAVDRKNRLDYLIQYLVKLGSDFQDIIFDCSRMLYKESLTLVFNLFVQYAPVDGGEPISREAIMNHIQELSEQDENQKSEWDKKALLILYLRNLIWEKKETKPIFHTQLVYSYMSSISSLQEYIKAVQGMQWFFNNFLIIF